MQRPNGGSNVTSLKRFLKAGRQITCGGDKQGLSVPYLAAAAH